MTRMTPRLAAGLFASSTSLALVAGPAINPPAAEAQGEPDSIKELEALLNTPVVSASKREQKSMESPQAVEVITGDQIRASGAFRLMDLLRFSTNLQIYDMDGQVSRVAMRGVAPNGTPKTIQVLVDGVALYNSEVYPLDIEGLPVPLESIERVEIVRGPSSSLYGANAQLGVISITTRRAGQGAQASVHVGGADHGALHTQASLALGSEHWGLTAGVGVQSVRALDEPYREVGSAVTYQPENQYHQRQVFVRPEFRYEDGSLWAAFGQSFKRTGPETAIAPNGTGLYTYGTDGFETDLFQAGWSQTWSATLKTTLRFNHTKELNGFGNGIYPVAGNPASPTYVNLVRNALPTIDDMAYLTDVSTDEAAFQLNWDPSGTFHVVAGADSRKMKTPGASVLGIPAKEPTASGGFVSIDWNLGKATVSGGVRAENETLGGSRTSPRFAVVVPVGSESVWRVGYFTSTRSPQMVEVYQTLNSPVVASIYTPNPDLKPEEADNVELGYRRAFAKWTFDATIYRMTLKKLIASTVIGSQGNPPKPVLQFQNSPTSPDNKGLELAVKGEVMAGWLLGANASYVDYKDPATQDQAAFAPRIVANLWSRVKSGSWFGYVALQSLGSYATTSTKNATNSEEPARLRVDFNIGCDLTPRLSVSAYGLDSTRPVSYSAAAGLSNQFLTRYSRRELGLQAAWRF